MSAFTDDRWYQREIVTDELDECCDAIAAGLGISRSAVGTKGNTAHDSGSHRSQEWILNSPDCDNRSYTVQSGLTADQLRHIAGIDITPGVWGTVDNRRKTAAITARVIAAMKAGELDEVIEVFGCQPDLSGVTGYNNRENRSATSDSSHEEHVHLTCDRRRMRDRAFLHRLVAVVIGVPMSFLAPFKVGASGPHVQYVQYALYDLHEATRDHTDPNSKALYPGLASSPTLPATFTTADGLAMKRLLNGGDGVNFTPLLGKRLQRALGALDAKPGPQGEQGDPGDPGLTGEQVRAIAADVVAGAKIVPQVGG